MNFTNPMEHGFVISLNRYFNLNVPSLFDFTDFLSLQEDGKTMDFVLLWHCGDYLKRSKISWVSQRWRVCPKRSYI